MSRGIDVNLYNAKQVPENAELKEDFRQKCSDAFSVVEKAIDNGTFQDFKKQVDKDRQEIYLMLKDEKALKEYEFLKADLRQQEIDARIKKEKAEEEARIKRETDIKDGIKKDFTSRADILVVACGVPKLITADMVKDDAVVVDLGINGYDDNTVGDVDFEGVKEKASFITPVPGGVGPMTIVSLMKNTLLAGKKAIYK